jgi:hypothetical protein
MSAETTQFDREPTADPLPQVSMEALLESLAGWALHINERERRVDEDPQDSLQRPAGSRQEQVGQPRVERHLGRHRSGT